jgi:hypothetical protein
MHCSPTKSIKKVLIKRFAVLSSREQTLNVANGQQTVTGEHKLDILRDTSKWAVHSIRLLQ